MHKIIMRIKSKDRAMIESLVATYFATIGGVAALNVIVTEFINNAIGAKGWVKQVISWACPMLIAILGLVFGWGIFAGYGTIGSFTAWIYTILTGLGTGLVSNGIYDIKYVQNAIEFIKELFTKTQINK